MAFDAASTTTYSAVTGVSWSHTCSGSDRVLYACVSRNDGSAFVSPGATYNSVAMSVLVNAVAGAASHIIPRLIAPATGANTIAATWSGSADGAAIGHSRTGIHQTSPEGSEQRTSGTSGTPANAATSASGKEVIDFVSAQDGGASGTATGDNTERADVAAFSGFPLLLSSDAPGAASVAMNWTVLGGASEWMSSAFSLDPAAGGADPGGIVFNLQIG